MKRAYLPPYEPPRQKREKRDTVWKKTVVDICSFQRIKIRLFIDVTIVHTD
jgi:hypothetical protein